MSARVKVRAIGRFAVCRAGRVSTTTAVGSLTDQPEARWAGESARALRAYQQLRAILAALATRNLHTAILQTTVDNIGHSVRMGSESSWGER